jgi:twitching motility protein PilT
MTHFQQLIRAARGLEASDLHLVAGLSPAIRANGEILMLQTPPIDRDGMRALVDGILNDEQRNQLEMTRELCFSTFDDQGGRMRVTVYFHAGCPEVSVRMCALKISDSATLGLPPILDELARRPNGLVLIAGATGSGKTTTLNYMVDLINRERRAKIITIEDPVEYVHRPQKSIVVQQEVHSDTLSFPRALIHALRQNPDIIVIGEMRELEAISTAVTAAETGHLVLATLHTPNTVLTVERVTAVFPAGQQRQVTLQLANVLQGVITQDLIPTADRKGRTLAYEVMIGTPAVRACIREDKLQMLYNVIETGRKDGMVTMDQVLLDLYQRGVITYDAAISRARMPERFARRPDAPSGVAGGGAKARRRNVAERPDL